MRIKPSAVMCGAVMAACVCGAVRAQSARPFDSSLVLSLSKGELVAQDKPRPRASIAQVGWIAGTWAGGPGAPGVTFEERWTPPAGGAMLAVSRTLRGDRMVAFEFLRIVERDGGLVYIAQPNGRPPTDFVLTEVTATSAVFENPAHDFPKMIRYAKLPDGALEARISDGGQRAETFTFRRVP
jgi:hypothetical protein